MKLSTFERGLLLGWFGNDAMDDVTAKNIVQELKKLFMPVSVLGGTSKASPIVIFKLYLDNGPLPASFPPLVNWYFYDEVNPETPMMHASPDLALRLALPSAVKSGAGRSEYIVFEVAATHLRDPRSPRCTDRLTLEGLDLWRPGGKTKPLKSGLAGLNELVDHPVHLGQVATDVRVIVCEEL